MLRVALTGGIGTGKSTVLDRWRQRSVPVVDADAVVHDLLRAGAEGTRAVTARFGPEVLGPDGAVDRRQLGVLVFADPAARDALEAIVHPAVYAAVDGWMAAQDAAGARVAVAEIPLLFETGHAGAFDRIVVTVCQPEHQVSRAVARGAQEADVRRRIAAQWPAEEKARLADFVIRTDGPVAETLAAADDVLDRLRAEAACEA